MTTPDGRIEKDLVAFDGRQPALPVFLRKDANGISINASRLSSPSELPAYVDELFQNGWRFQGLDYALFHRLIYYPPATPEANEWRMLARDIVQFPKSRRELYKLVKLLDHKMAAEYHFEPAFLEVPFQIPVYGDLDQSGNQPITGYIKRTRYQSTTLDVDEFITAMWEKNVRFGLKIFEIESAISAKTIMRVQIAKGIPPAPGIDAKILEVYANLHRDDSPLIRNGKADFRRFKNRFPQILEGTKILKKIPIAFGRPGYSVTGEICDPPLPRDINLESLAGPGTTIVTWQGEEYIAAKIDGFLFLDQKLNKISVCERLDDKGGVSIKSTGDLSLVVDEFVEHGEVQEGRLIEGMNMHFTSSVYGSLISAGGNISLDENLSFGDATSWGGKITVRKRAIHSTIEANGGSIELAYAEHCLIVGEHVTVVEAINCDILAQTLEAGSLNGCGVAARSIQIGSSNSIKDNLTIISVLHPDLAKFNKRSSPISKEIERIEKDISVTDNKILNIKSEPALSKYLATLGALKARSGKTSGDEEKQIRQMQMHHLATLKALEVLLARRKELQSSLSEQKQEMQRIENERHSLVASCRCKISRVSGETLVKHLGHGVSYEHLSQLTKTELKRLLRSHSGGFAKIFSGSQGSLDWHNSAQTSS